MESIEDRSRAVYFVIGIVVIAVAIHLLFPRQASRKLAIPVSTDSHLIYTIENLNIEEAVRTLLLQRSALARSGVAAHIAEDQDPDFDLYVIAAESAYMMGDLRGARDAYAALLERNPLNYVTWNNMGNTLSRMGDGQGAIEAYTQAISIRSSEEYYRDYITALQKFTPENVEEIERAFKEAVADIGQTPWSMIAFAKFYLEQGDCDRAMDHYEVAEDIVDEPGQESLQKDIEKAKDACS